MATIESYQTSTGATRYMVRYRTRSTPRPRNADSPPSAHAKEFAATVEVEKLTGKYVAPVTRSGHRWRAGPAGWPARRTTKPVGRRGWNRSGGSMSNRTGVAVASLTFGEPRSKSGWPN